VLLVVGWFAGDPAGVVPAGNLQGQLDDKDGFQCGDGDDQRLDDVNHGGPPWVMDGWWLWEPWFVVLGGRVAGSFPILVIVVFFADIENSLPPCHP
jgi:hypothetical protein